MIGTPRGDFRYVSHVTGKITCVSRFLKSWHSRSDAFDGAAYGKHVLFLTKPFAMCTVVNMARGTAHPPPSNLPSCTSSHQSQPCNHPPFISAFVHSSSPPLHRPPPSPSLHERASCEIRNKKPILQIHQVTLE